MKSWRFLLLACWIVVFLFLIICKDASVEHYNLGHRYYTRAQYGAEDPNDQIINLAIIEFTKAIEINPGYAEAYHERGLAYDAKGEYDLAISDYNKAIEINPRYERAYNHRRLAKNAKGRNDPAISD
ncbi:MAG: tetratricopeptide repeat protein [Candidatus Hermodarchaeia archaeon]|jgi:tetratricopeptide (TPR) repeat protein